MEIQQLEKTRDKLFFVIKGIDPVIANTLRRVMLVEVPVMAIDEVTFIKNSSALFDEILAHRLGLIPLKTDLRSYNLRDKCSCKGEGCSRCQVTITLSMKGPCTVYASDLKIKDPKITIVYGKMPLVKLLKNQELEIEATARLGIGKEHNKFSPGLIYYRAYPEIKINSNCNYCLKCVELCPKNVLDEKNKKLVVKNVMSCDLCMACLEACPKHGINLKSSETDFIFCIESWGQLETKEIFDKATGVFNEKLEEFHKKLKKA